MSDFIDPPKLPVSRILFYGLCAIGVFIWMGYKFNNKSLILAGLICVPVVIFVVLEAYKVGRSRWAIRNRRLLFGIYFILLIVSVIVKHFGKGH
jgi:ABC-type maltose transport system permease subunit